MSNGLKKTDQVLVGAETRTIRSGTRSRIVYIVKCPQCTKQFEARRKRAVFCSKDCYQKHYKAKPRFFDCVVCGKTFEQKNRNGYYSHRQTCSTKCHHRLSVSNNVFDEKRRKHMSNICKDNNAVAVLHTPEVRKKAAPKISRAKTGVHNVKNAALGCSKGGKTKTLVSPKGIHYTTDCIRHFVRTNEQLFNEDDIVRYPNCYRSNVQIEGNLTCRAMKGLGEVARQTKGSWKGWTLKI